MHITARTKLYTLGILTLATVAGAGLARQATAADSKDEDAIKARIAEFIDLFNKGEAKAQSGYFTEDATLVNPAGKTAKGRAEIEKLISDDDATILKGAKMEMKVVQYHPLAKDVAWVELQHDVVGAKTPDGKTMPPMTFHVPTVMVKKGKTWYVAEARPYAYLPPPPAPTAKK